VILTGGPTVPEPAEWGTLEIVREIPDDAGIEASSGTPICRCDLRP
jgi:hypothetical protein